MRNAAEYFAKGDIETVERLYNFGLAIGNTDMHFGNISFFVGRDLPFKLAPAYDMLPMYYAPLSDGTLRNEPLPSIPPTAESREMAGDFWQTLAESGNVGKNFKRVVSTIIVPLSSGALVFLILIGIPPFLTGKIADS